MCAVLSSLALWAHVCWIIFWWGRGSFGVHCGPHFRGPVPRRCMGRWGTKAGTPVGHGYTTVDSYEPHTPGSSLAYMDHALCICCTVTCRHGNF